jgi:DNA-binding SARP family transcriptional activator
MQILVSRGNRAEALRVYEELRQRLRDELGALPAPELRELQGRLLRH